MNFRENAISVADKLRSPEDQVEYLQKNRIFPTSFNCPACDIVCERTGKVAPTTSTSDALIVILKGALGIVFCSWYTLFQILFGVDVFWWVNRRTGTLLSDKKIEMRTFVLIAYFFVACFLTHQQLIHEVSLTLANGYFKTSKEKKTCCQTTVLYIFYNLGEFFPGYFRCFTIKDFCNPQIFFSNIFSDFFKELSKWLANQSQILWCKDFVIVRI